jgi:hypothetical protein
MSYFGSKDFGEYLMSLDHGEDSIGDPADYYTQSSHSQHDRELDNDGEIVMKHLAVITADNPAVCFLFVPHATLPPCDQEAVIVFEKDLPSHAFYFWPATALKCIATRSSCQCGYHPMRFVMTILCFRFHPPRL